MALHSKLTKTVSSLTTNQVSTKRRNVLQPLIEYIQNKVVSANEVNLNFICTHNSRRSQLAQLWAQTAAYFYNIPANCFSGGVEETAFNERAVASIERQGFKVAIQGEENPQYAVSYAEDAEPLIMFSKLFNDRSNPSTAFAAVMTCSHADENCPLIPGTEKRVPLLYDDPKEYDGTIEESSKYDERSTQIATELFYVFSKVSYK